MTKDVCTACNQPMPVNRATLACGLQHVECRYAWRSLTASTRSLEEHALTVWRLRRDLARALRRHGVHA
jgi:hypothetical protein